MNGRNNEFEGMWKETWPDTRCCTGFSLEGQRETTENYSQASCVPSEVQIQFRNAAVAGDLPQHVSEVYEAAVVTSEHLRDLNKYWCEQCLRYNEARRCVRYETLPKLLVLQLKRFSSTFG